MYNEEFNYQCEYIVTENKLTMIFVVLLKRRINKLLQKNNLGNWQIEYISFDFKRGNKNGI